MQSLHAIRIRSGTNISGPAIIEQPDTTIFILPKWHVKANEFGTLKITRISLMKLDPVTIEIFFHKFTAITEEMAITLQRSARTTYVKEAGDFGTALATPEGRFFAYPNFLGVSGFLDSNVGPMISRIDSLHPGDVIITNHPYESEGLATHMPDLHLVRPIFHNERIVAYVGLHTLGRYWRGVPSSISPSSPIFFKRDFKLSQ